MTKKIKYQGRTYILESSLDKIIKDKLELKIEDTLEDVLGLDNGPEFGEPGLEGDFGGLEGDPTLDGAPEVGAGNPAIDSAIEAIKTALGISDIPSDILSHLTLILEDIVAGSAPAEAPIEEPVGDLGGDELEAPDTILHEGKIFRKIGKVSKSMMESITNAPKTISVGGKIFKLAGN